MMSVTPGTTTKVQNIILLLAIGLVAGCQSFANESASCDWSKPASAPFCTASQMSTNGKYASLNANTDLAIDWYRKAAEGGDAEGQTSLALAYFQVMGLKRTMAKPRNGGKSPLHMGLVPLKLILRFVTYTLKECLVITSSPTSGY